MARHVIGTTADIAPGQGKAVTLQGREIAVFNLNGDYFALGNRCPHEGGPLCQGKRTSLFESDRPGRYQVSRPGEMVRCPWHGWEFDIRTGQSYCDPTRMRVRVFDISVEPGQRVAEGPYVAETFTVSVEADYLVIDL